jgi:hypothetical protein
VPAPGRGRGRSVNSEGDGYVSGGGTDPGGSYGTTSGGGYALLTKPAEIVAEGEFFV